MLDKLKAFFLTVGIIICGAILILAGAALVYVIVGLAIAIAVFGSIYCIIMDSIESKKEQRPPGR
jgi:hypothetical protein